MTEEKAKDPVVEANRQMLLDRSNLGIQKYGKMLDRPDLTLRDWLQHALEETLDEANYLQASIRFLDTHPQAVIRQDGMTDEMFIVALQGYIKGGPDGRTMMDLDIVNHNNERRHRTVIPMRIRWDRQLPWFPEATWLLDAYDVDKEADRTFAVNRMHGFGPHTVSAVSVQIGVDVAAGAGRTDETAVGFVNLDDATRHGLSAFGLNPDDFEVNPITQSVNGQLQDYSGTTVLEFQSIGDSAPTRITTGGKVVTFDDYQRLAMRTAPPGEELLDGLNHAALGFLTELGEVAAAGEDHKHAGEEIGDTAWYVALATAHLDQPLGALMDVDYVDALAFDPGLMHPLVFAAKYATEVKRAKIYGKTLSDDMRNVMLGNLKCLMIGLAEQCRYRGLNFNDVLQENIDKLRKRFPDKFSGAAAEARADKGGVDARNS